MERFRVYDTPHKGIRRGFAEVMVALGQTDWSRPSTVIPVLDLTADLLRVLELHADIENNVVLADLELRVPGATHHDTHDHEELELVHLKLNELVSSMKAAAQRDESLVAQGRNLLEGINALIAEHLEHMGYEETVTQQLLWDNFSDEELMAQLPRIMQSHGPDDMILMMRFILPGLSQPERQHIVQGMRANAPEPFLHAVLAAAGPFIPEPEFDALLQTPEPKYAA
ncbi:MAG TPA: hypothetical protein DIS79_01945 [Bacteroidetes bacterium]|nr:hypothetical protein [Bacteroidota bacterium]HRK04104.1 hemerythrin domain-containing protein [Chlorobiota bacterium]